MALTEVGFLLLFATLTKALRFPMKKNMNGITMETLAHFTLNSWRIKVPNYDFKCNECQTTVEMYMGFDDQNVLFCVTCEGPLTKVFTPTPAHFKGGGWGGK